MNHLHHVVVMKVKVSAITLGRLSGSNAKSPKDNIRFIFVEVFLGKGKGAVNRWNKKTNINQGKITIKLL